MCPWKITFPLFSHTLVTPSCSLLSEALCSISPAQDSIKKYFHHLNYLKLLPFYWCSQPHLRPSNPDNCGSTNQQSPQTTLTPSPAMKISTCLSLAYLFQRKTQQPTHRLCVKLYNSHQLIFPLHIPPGSEISEMSHTQESELYFCCSFLDNQFTVYTPKPLIAEHRTVPLQRSKFTW